VRDLILPIAIFALAWYAVLSAVSYFVYWRDKRAAMRGDWRVPEKTLHLLDALGGWPGGRLAQNTLKHKRRKGSFMLVFWLSASLHVGGWIALFVLALR